MEIKLERGNSETRITVSGLEGLGPLKYYISERSIALDCRNLSDRELHQIVEKVKEMTRASKDTPPVYREMLQELKKIMRIRDQR